MPAQKEKKVKKKPIPKHQKEKIKKIAVAVIKNPEATEREIAESTWIAKSTVHDNIGHIGQVKDERVEKVLKKDKSIVEKAQKIIEQSLDIELKIREENEKVINDDTIPMADKVEKLVKNTMNYMWANQLAKDSATRYMLFKWEVTDETGWLKDLATATMKEIEQKLKDLLN